MSRWNAREKTKLLLLDIRDQEQFVNALLQNFELQDDDITMTGIVEPSQTNEENTAPECQL